MGRRGEGEAACFPLCSDYKVPRSAARNPVATPQSRHPSGTRVSTPICHNGDPSQVRGPGRPSPLPARHRHRRQSAPRTLSLGARRGTLNSRPLGPVAREAQAARAPGPARPVPGGTTEWGPSAASAGAARRASGRLAHLSGRAALRRRCCLLPVSAAGSALWNHHTSPARCCSAAAASAAALCSLSECRRLSRPPQPPRRAATMPSRPLGPRPRPPRYARRRLRLRAADAAATDAAASSSAPPSLSLKANKHHGGRRRPPASKHPDRRRRSNIPATHWPVTPGATIRRRGGALLTPLPQAPPPYPRAGRRWAGPARYGPAPPLLFPRLFPPSSLRFCPSFLCPLLFNDSVFHPVLFYLSRAFTFVSSLPSFFLVFLSFCLLITWKHGQALRLLTLASILICLKTRRSIVNSYMSFPASKMQKKLLNGSFQSINGY